MSAMRQSKASLLSSCSGIRRIATFANWKWCSSMSYREGTRRSVERVPVNMKVQFEVLIPEHTFSARPYEGLVSNISERGAMVVVNLDPQIGRSLLHRTRDCR